MLHQYNEKNLSAKETIVVSQDCPNSTVTCDSQGINWILTVKTSLLCLLIQLTN